MRRNCTANKYKNGTIFSMCNYQCAIGNDNCTLIIAELPIDCDYGFRNYDKKQRRFTSVDPLTAKYPELTPFQFASNTPIMAIDLDGLEKLVITVTEISQVGKTYPPEQPHLSNQQKLFASEEQFN